MFFLNFKKRFILLHILIKNFITSIKKSIGRLRQEGEDILYQNKGNHGMCRTIVGISANLCPVDEAGKNIHTSVSRKFVDGVRMVGGLPMVIPVGDKKFSSRLCRNDWQADFCQAGKMFIHQFYGEEKTIDSDDYNIVRDEFELALLKKLCAKTNQSWLFAAVCSWSMLLLVALSINIIENHWQGLPFGTSHSIRTGERQRSWSVCLVRLARLIRSIAKASRTWRLISARQLLTQRQYHRSDWIGWQSSYHRSSMASGVFNKRGKGQFWLFQYLLQEL